jgi:formylglycine-generating enzyme required for sulfatase activity
MGLAATCGMGANDNCCRAATVTGGTFHRSYDGVGFTDMSFPAMVSTFVLDKYEVTVGRFRAFVDAGLGTQASPPAAGAGAHPKLAGSGWDSAWNTSLAADTSALTAAVKCDSTYQTWTDAPGGNENKPMNCVRWYEAMAFCIWDGGYLPTEAEWNYAASGGSEQRVYPWSAPGSSTTIDCTYANYDPGTACVSGGTNRVGSESPRGDGRDWGLGGHSDLAGNVWEWTLDWYASTYPTMSCDDCANLTPATNRVVRGGGFGNVASALRAADRNNGGPINRYSHVGFRCARTP